MKKLQLLLCLFFLILMSCTPGPEMEDETEAFKEDIRNYNNSFDGDFTIAVKNEDGKNIDFTYYYYTITNGKKTSTYSKYVEEGPKSFNYNGDKFCITKVTSSGYYDWNGLRSTTSSGNTFSFTLVRK